MKYLFLLLSLAIPTFCFAQQPQHIYMFNLNDIRLLDSPFKDAQETNLKYLLAMDPDRLLSPFQKEAGLPQKAQSYNNWESTGLNGHIGGHYLSALSLMFASTHNSQIKERLDYMIDELQKCQKAHGNGYIGGVPEGKTIWTEIAQGNIHAHKFSLNGKWVPLYNLHKTYAGLRDAWLYTKNKKAKKMLIEMSDWAIDLVSRLSEEQIQDMLRCEHGGLNEVFADVAIITGNKKYLKLAYQFSHNAILTPLLQKEDKLEGLHANTQIPKIIGYKRIADLDGNVKWAEAASFFWDTVIEKRSVCIGGNSANEQFHNAEDFSKMINGIHGPETCNTYNMLRLSKMLYQTSLNKKYIEYYECALYNHILSSQHPQNGGLVYFTPMRPGHYRVYSQPHTSMWCCVGSGMENHSKYGEMIYAYSKNNLFVNLFIPSHLEWKDKKTTIIQKNNFPYEAKTTLIINPSKKVKFTLQIRYPDWVNKAEIKIYINGKRQVILKNKTGYIPLEREWRKADKVEIELPMSIRVQQLPDKSNYYSFLYGPIVLAAKTGTEDLQGLYANDSRKGHEAQGHRIPFKDMPMIIGNPDSLAYNVIPTITREPLTFQLTNLYPRNKWQNLQLKPFFLLHDSRYIIYWPQATVNNVVAIRKEKDRQERNILHLDTITIDQIACGQQQSESDHFIKMNNSSSGYTKGMHWRNACGWFSYQLINKNKTSSYLYVSYLDCGNDKTFDIFLNGIKVETANISSKQSEQIVEAIYPIPKNIGEKENLIVRFVPKKTKQTDKIIEIRLLNKMP
ncbi:glycoside hydrolase family 127 protein [Phocaeicola sartorii]|uniref:glycoside hydrolase family 127 protein n=1 Tax=Phocaeicola sartorii TaxID=671267 RepID=UPI001F578E12|nr:glycoside hydrolase family 127 protein [Phocaeicola sartorii]